MLSAQTATVATRYVLVGAQAGPIGASWRRAACGRMGTLAESDSVSVGVSGTTHFGISFVKSFVYQTGTSFLALYPWRCAAPSLRFCPSPLSAAAPQTPRGAPSSLILFYCL